MSAQLAVKTICIVGVGYIGMASAIGLAELGHQVRGYDIDGARLRGLQNGITPYLESGIQEALQRQLDRDAIRFFPDLAEAVAGADYVFVAVGTPVHESGAADLTAVDGAMAALKPLLNEGVVIVLRSTVPVGTSERIDAEIRNSVVFAPEFLREGSALSDFFNPDRIVVGAAVLETADAYSALFTALDRPFVVTTLRNAELIKAFSTAFLAVKISFANEVANFCELLDADAPAVLSGVGFDSRIGRSMLSPGIGFGGPCVEKDLKNLEYEAGRYGAARDLITATLKINDAQPKRIVNILEHEIGGLEGARIGVWGLAFKAGTDDVRDSLALRIIDDLHARGAATVAYDPKVTALPPGHDGCTLAPSALEAIANCDALLVLTEWPEFGLVSPWAIAEHLRLRVVVDGRNVLDPRAIDAAGLRYRGVGRTIKSNDMLASLAG